jgi:hypothetical protein
MNAVRDNVDVPLSDEEFDALAERGKFAGLMSRWMTGSGIECRYASAAHTCLNSDSRRRVSPRWDCRCSIEPWHFSLT